MFALTELQTARLLACAAAWHEGEDEEYLLRLRQRAEDADTLRAIQYLLKETDLAQGGVLNYGQAARLLALVRALAPNPNLDSRLLRQPGEPEALNRDLRDLLFSDASLASRLRGFLSRRHAGGQTALQWLCAANPQEWPFVTQTGIRALEIGPEQRRDTLQAARSRFALPPAPPFAAAGEGLPDSDPVLRSLADILIYEAAHDILQPRDYIEMHRMMTQGLADKPRRTRRFTPTQHPTPNTQYPTPNAQHPTPYPTPDTLININEAAAPYRTAPEAESKTAPNFAPPDVDGMRHRDTLEYIENYVAAQGFHYAPLTLRDYYIALQTKPFCLLSGLTGTGKTRLTSLFAEALTGSDAQYRLLPVRPDWADSAPLLGYVNLLAGSGSGRYVSTPFAEFLQRAAQPENAYRAFFLCLDELNLARVEHYLAEILSAMETPTREILLPDGRVLRLPANFFLSGTLNLDEATYALSRKVLDRANLFSFEEVCLRDEAGKGVGVRVSGVGEQKTEAREKGKGKREKTEEAESIQNPKSKIQKETTPDTRHPIPASQWFFLQSRVTTVAAARARLAELAPDGSLTERILETLESANLILQPSGLHFAYRVRDEILRYCANSFDWDGAGLLAPAAPEDRRANLQTALDLQILQKLLPRFSGASAQIETPARELQRWAAAHSFPRAARKLNHILARLERDGFADFNAL